MRLLSLAHNRLFQSLVIAEQSASIFDSSFHANGCLQNEKFSILKMEALSSTNEQLELGVAEKTFTGF